MVATLDTATATEILRPEELLSLICTAQDVPMTIETEEDGSERTVYGSTPAAEAALDRLTTAFLPLMRKIAGAGRSGLGFDEALGILAEEFVRAVRRYDPTSDVAFHVNIQAALTRVVYDTARSQRGIISVPESSSGRYLQLLNKHGGDLAAAYRECRTTANGLEPHTFLAIHAALSSSDVSLDAPTEAGEETGERPAANIADPSDQADRIATADLVRWLLEQVSERQDRILRLRFGFQDTATENLRCEFGFHPGAMLSDREISGVIGGGVATISRQKREALLVMRNALVEALSEEVGE